MNGADLVIKWEEIKVFKLMDSFLALIKQNGEAFESQEDTKMHKNCDKLSCLFWSTGAKNKIYWESKKESTGWHLFSIFCLTTK